MADTFAPVHDSQALNGAMRRLSMRQVGPYELLAGITIAYLLVALIFVTAAGSDPVHLLLRSAASLKSFAQMAQVMVPWWMVIAIVGLLVGVGHIRRRIWQNKREILLSLIYCAVFTSVFGVVKNHLPTVVPFWADPLLTRIDAYTNPTVLFSWLNGFSTDALFRFYINGWVLIATFLPAILAVIDRNEARRRNFILLWAACWVGLGNVLALIFMSVGPIFLDRLPGGDMSAYVWLSEMLARDDARVLMLIKDQLWNTYAGQDFMIGSGISAFPSVHVGMATVVALYLATVLRELAGRIALPAGRTVLRVLGWVVPVALVSVFQMLSVHLGWHYAVDGYASIALMCALYWALLRRDDRHAAKKASISKAR